MLSGWNENRRALERTGRKNVGGEVCEEQHGEETREMNRRGNGVCEEY